MSYSNAEPPKGRHSKMFKLILEAEEQARLSADAPVRRDLQSAISEKIKAQSIASLRPMSALQSNAQDAKSSGGQLRLKWPRLRAVKI